jgi:dimethylglycine dehydrogenase
MGVKRMCVGFAPAIVGRLSVTGELGFEIYVPTLYLQPVFDLVQSAAVDFDGRFVGMYALNSLRLEKSFGIWSREYSRDYTPQMAGLERFIAYEKAAFIGRDAALRNRGLVPRHRLVTLAVESEDADASGYEPIFHGTDYVGFVTSGGYGHCAQASLAMGYLSSSIADGQAGLSVTILGEKRRARVLPHPIVDPSGSRMRA